MRTESGLPAEPERATDLTEARVPAEARVPMCRAAPQALLSEAPGKGCAIGTLFTRQLLRSCCMPGSAEVRKHEA